ncbi:glycerol-3-phosphate 1-O-acyltransferase PlsY [Alphaproteobacteria bacterium]|nr:glycerol-3-phosphate 1-O-acyltransferase PlsY [Alphaproteobacteria bacterium]
MIFDNSHLLFLSVFFFGYFMGSIPFGLLLTKISGLGDIRNIGSGNIGATNVLRTGNKKMALLTLILDGTKGGLAIYVISISPSFIEFYFTNNINLFQSLVAVSAVIGHCFPIWLNFKGGKGVATGFGTIIFINMYVGVIALLIWVSIAKLFRISSLSALISYLFIPILMFFFTSEKSFFIASILISLICYLQHRENIKRLLNGSEAKI